MASPGSEVSAAQVIEAVLADLDLEWSRRDDVFTVSLPGTHKLVTECALDVGRHTVLVRAFVARAPEQDAEAVYRWLLERNLRLNGIAFSLDHLGDVYLVGRTPVALVDASWVDLVLGAVGDTADASFDPVVALGFADSIRSEWAWRRARGESTANLAAFTELDPQHKSATHPKND